MTWTQALAVAFAAIITFQLAYGVSGCSLLIVGWLFCLCVLTRLRTDRSAFYVGLLVGLCAYGPQLYFFYTIFGAAALVLWLVLAFWLGLFLLLARKCRERFGAVAAALLIPFLWTGLEYFRSELYYLRFSWLNVGYVFSENLRLPFMKILGVYGTGFVLMALMAWLALVRRKLLAIYAIGVSFLAVLLLDQVKMEIAQANGKEVTVAGMQLEFPVPLEVPLQLDKLIQQNPDAQLLVLSEYTFDGPVPQRVKDWCRNHQRYLIVGGKDPVAEPQFYNTTFVIDTNGDVVFQQAKSVPIQFFKDGLPAKEQKLWDSPWGKIGICVCYDLSYTRVTDRLIRQGAQALIVPTMDVAEWGKHQHQLHARVAPVRAAEYCVPIFRVCSSGISQLIDRTGHVISSAPFPGEQAMIGGQLRLEAAGERPLDRWLAPLAVAVTVLVVLTLALTGGRRRAAIS